jgi:hypothetical protein
LFEFKAPLRSLPDGKIPKHYRPQIQTGMITIPMVEVSIFVNNCFRKCSIKDIGFSPVYDVKFHDGDLTKKITKKQRFADVLACGIICFYQTMENYNLALTLCGYNSESDSESESDFNDVFNQPEIDNSSRNYSNTEYDIDLLMGTREKVLDLGVSHSRMLDRLLELCEEKRVHMVYYPMILNQSAINELEFIQEHKKVRAADPNLNPKKIIKDNLDEFEQYCIDQEYHPIGYMPWKLLKSDIIMETPEESWKDQIEPVILDAIQKIDDILGSANPREKYLEYYPEVDDNVEAHTSDLALFTATSLVDDEASI